MRVTIAGEILESGSMPDDSMELDDGIGQGTGSARSARNALKHGLRAKKFVMSDEDADAYQEYRIELMNELRPLGTLETGYANRIAQELWRSQRCMAIEAEMFDHEREGIGERDYTLGEVFARGSKGVALLIRYQTAIDRSLERAVRSLQRLQRGRMEQAEEGEDWLPGRQFSMPERLRGWSRDEIETMIRDGVNPFARQPGAAQSGPIATRPANSPAAPVPAQQPAQTAASAPESEAEGAAESPVISTGKPTDAAKSGQNSKRAAAPRLAPRTGRGTAPANARDLKKKGRRGKRRR
jgi:hypothetical protein